MNKKRILLISLIAVAIIVSVSAVSAGFLEDLFGGGQQQDNVIEIDNITFNTTNATKFELFNETKNEAGDFKWYQDVNHTGYNVHIYNYSDAFNKSDDITWNDALKSYKGYDYDNIPSQTVNGVVVYTSSANVGGHVGEPRYKAYIENRDLKTIVDFWSPDANETAKMALSLKFK